MEGDDGRGFYLVDEVSADLELDEDSALAASVHTDQEKQRQAPEEEGSSDASEPDKKSEDKDDKSVEKLADAVQVFLDTEPPPAPTDSSEHDVTTMAEDGQMAYATMMSLQQAEGDSLAQAAQMPGDQPFKKDEDEEPK
ncbi:hypothetical protein V5799_012205 [Amblyomma americanum]|uniref:Uncharacterized protein n=1 Tax=Amblyomma americanum TaxID=6943 RepID=A0AAQ4EFF1_AMBAM